MLELELVAGGVPGLLAGLTRHDSQLQMRALDAGCLLHLGALLEPGPSQEALDEDTAHGDHVLARTLAPRVLYRPRAWEGGSLPPWLRSTVIQSAQPMGC